MDWEVSLMMWYWPGFMACPTTLASPPEIALIVRAKVQGQPTLVDRKEFCQSFIFLTEFFSVPGKWLGVLMKKRLGIGWEDGFPTKQSAKFPHPLRDSHSSRCEPNISHHSDGNNKTLILNASFR